MENVKFGDLEVSIGSSREEMDEAAAAMFAAKASQSVAERGTIAVILATGNSQLGFIQAVARRDDIPWSRITVLHMDEYVGMAETHPASFRLWMKKNVVEPCAPQGFEGIRGDAESVESEIQRYEGLLRDLRPAICVMGIGENGHLAFNDPPAEFDTPHLVRVVEMDQMSREQQVGEGHFPSVADVPREAITLTVPALLQPETVLVVTPESRKARAVQGALEGPVTPSLPASILQTQSHAHLFLDRESASLLARSTQ
jgi:glucosamine-6-phosphate deaminase